MYINSRELCINNNRLVRLKDKVDNVHSKVSVHSLRSGKYKIEKRGK